MSKGDSCNVSGKIAFIITVTVYLCNCFLTMVNNIVHDEGDILRIWKCYTTSWFLINYEELHYSVQENP